MADPQKQLIARPYRNFLTPALHRRFTHAALFTLIVCYAEAVWMGEWSLRMWLPPIRTLLIFISSLAVYVLRVGNLHIGAYSTTSPFETFRRRLFQLDTFQTLVWYSFSAWWFSEVYIWSAPAEAKLWWVDYGRTYERSRLNERPIYFRTMFLFLAMTQSLFHLCWDYDMVTLQTKSPKSLHQPLPWIKSIGPRMLHNAISRTAFCGLGGSLIYLIFIRRPLWNFAFSVASSFFTLQRNQRPPVIGGLMDMIGRFLVEGFLLELLWEFCNAIFTDHVAEEPLKRGQPLTNDSKDPNGSLLHGLKAKKEVPREFAFWELDLIATKFAERRKTIFTELELRPPLVGAETTEKNPIYPNKSEPPISRNKATWTHVKSICLDEIQRIDNRIKLVLDPPKKLTPEQQQAAIQSLPSLSINPLKKDNILEPPTPGTTRITKTVDTLGRFARSHGQSPRPPSSAPISTRASQLLLPSTTSPTAPTALQPDSLRHQLTALATHLLTTPLGAPFRTPFGRRAAAVLTGAPTARTGTITRAASALSHLVAHALREDEFGLVARDVPGIVRALAATLAAVERLLVEWPPDWTDVEGEREEGEGAEVVAGVRRALAEALERVLWAYGEYLESEGMKREEIVRARECVGRVKEVERRGGTGGVA